MGSEVVKVAATGNLRPQSPMIKSVVEDLQGFGLCTSNSVSATPVNWVLDRVLGKL